jgi:2-dehydropantoate 2-reductase
MEILVIGPGAIGLSVGAALLDAGHAVSFAARQQFVTLTNSGPGYDERTRAAKVITHPNQVRPADWVFLCVKAHQVSGAKDWLKAAVGPSTSLAILQNGVEHVERVAFLVPESTVVVPVVVDIPASRTAPGTVTWRERANLTVGNHAAGRALCKLFDKTFVNAEVTDDFITALWRKLCVNAPGGAVLALTGQTMHVFHEAGVAEVARAILSECIMVGRAEGANLPADIVDLQMQRFLNAAPDDTNSMYDDWKAGCETEWDARNAAIVRKGRLHGIPTPVSSIVVPLLAAQKSKIG